MSERHFCKESTALDDNVPLTAHRAGPFGNAVLRRRLATGVCRLGVLLRNEKKHDHMRERQALEILEVLR